MDQGRDLRGGSILLGAPRRPHNAAPLRPQPLLRAGEGLQGPALMTTSRARGPPSAQYCERLHDSRMRRRTMTENIADKIRADRQPEGEMFTLSGEARRLRSSLSVAEKWLEVARESDETGHLALTAEYTRDQLEEELSRTAFQMEVLRSRREWHEAREPVENVDE